MHRVFAHFPVSGPHASTGNNLYGEKLQHALTTMSAQVWFLPIVGVGRPSDDGTDASYRVLCGHGGILVFLCGVWVLCL
jgi:hypothetical protein